MKAVIALILALALLAIGIPLSRAIADGEQHTITRTVDPIQPGTGQARRTPDKAKPSDTTAARDTAGTPQAQTTR